MRKKRKSRGTRTTGQRRSIDRQLARARTAAMSREELSREKHDLLLDTRSPAIAELRRDEPVGGGGASCSRGGSADATGSATVDGAAPRRTREERACGGEALEATQRSGERVGKGGNQKGSPTGADQRELAKPPRFRCDEAVFAMRSRKTQNCTSEDTTLD